MKFIILYFIWNRGFLIEKLAFLNGQPRKYLKDLLVVWSEPVVSAQIICELFYRILWSKIFGLF